MNDKQPKESYVAQIIFSLVVLGAGIGFIWLMIVFKPSAEKTEAQVFLPQVYVATAAACEKPIPISSQGTIRAYRETSISAEVDGQVLKLSDNFLAGRFVKQGEVLIEIDPEPYQLALDSAKTQLAQAQLQLAQEQALADQAQADWQSLGRNIKEANDLALRKPQIALANSNIDAAQAQIRLAERRLERCTITAPYDGYIEASNIGVGEVIRSGTALGHMLDSSKVEISLPILNQDMAFIQLPQHQQIGSPVSISSKIGQELHRWHGTLVRLVPRVAGKNQQFVCIAEIEQPFSGSVPLLPDLFTEADITGNSIEGLFEIPRDAVHDGHIAWVVTDKNTLRRQDITIVRYNKQALTIDYPSETVLVSSGLQTGDRVCITRLPVMSPDMEVHILTDTGTVEK